MTPRNFTCPSPPKTRPSKPNDFASFLDDSARNLKNRARVDFATNFLFPRARPRICTRPSTACDSTARARRWSVRSSGASPPSKQRAFIYPPSSPSIVACKTGSWACFLESSPSLSPPLSPARVQPSVAPSRFSFASSITLGLVIHQKSRLRDFLLFSKLHLHHSSLFARSASPSRALLPASVRHDDLRASVPRC